MGKELQKEEERSKTLIRLESCGIASILLLGLILAIVVIVYLVENKPGDSKYKNTSPDVVSTPFAALDSGIQWLRDQEDNHRWPMGQNADGVLALRLGMGGTFKLHVSNLEFRIAVRSLENDLLVAMRENALGSSFWARGLLAKYIVALNSACIDVGSFLGSNLLKMLDEQYNALSVFYNGDGRALSWYALAYCTAEKEVDEHIVSNLTARNGTYKFGLEEAAMITIALSCLDNDNKTLYGEEVMMAQDFILARQKSDGSFGNEIETALALQAIMDANKTDLSGIKTRTTEYLSTFIQETSGGKYRNMAAASHVMTALAGKTFADANFGCTDQGTTTPAPGDPINVTIIFRHGSSRKDHLVTIKSGQSLFDALQKLQMTDRTFNFTSILTSRGRNIISINGISVNPNSLQYWRIRDNIGEELNKIGVSYIIPKHDSRYTFDITPTPPTEERDNTTTTTAMPVTVPKAMNYMIEELLHSMSRQSGWGDRQNAEAIIALRLADPQRFSLEKSTIDTDFVFGMNDMIVELALATRREDFNNDTFWTQGKLGQYIVGLTSVCIDPENFYGMNLLDILEKQTQENEDFYRSQRFALSWNVLAICTANRSVHNLTLEILGEHPGNYTFEIDEAAMIVMALSCVGDSQYLPAQQAAEEYILNRTNSDGSIGNEYSTALAVQALTRYSGSDGNVKNVIEAAKDWLAGAVYGKPVNVALADQVLPALVSRSYVDVKYLPCPEVQTVTTTPETTTGGAITVNVSVTDYVTSSPAFSRMWEAMANAGDSLYEVLMKLEKQQPSFNFTSLTTSFGQMMTSIVGITVDSNQQQYWEILKFPDISISTGISSTYPVDGEHYIFNVTTW